jgi:hypothetical protein
VSASVLDHLVAGRLQYILTGVAEESPRFLPPDGGTPQDCAFTALWRPFPEHDHATVNRAARRLAEAAGIWKEGDGARFDHALLFPWNAEAGREAVIAAFDAAIGEEKARASAS